MDVVRSLRVIQAMTDWPEAQLLDSLAEALATGLLRIDRPGPPATYGFSHAIVRQTIPPRWGVP